MDENKRGRIGEGWTKIRGAHNKRGRKLKGPKIKGSKVYHIDFMCLLWIIYLLGSCDKDKHF